MRSVDAPDLRQSENKEVANFVTKALTEKTGIELVKINDVEYYLCGVPIPDMGWAVISVVIILLAAITALILATRVVKPLEHMTERMLDALNQTANESPEMILKNVRIAVDGFVKEAEQFDDLTMLCLEYAGKI